GKSVLLKCILGLENPDIGNIIIDDISLSNINASKRELINKRMGMLFQYGALFDSLNVWENIAFGLIQGQGVAKHIARDIAVERLSDVGLGADVINLYPVELSGGMRKRVALARAIATKPDILFFDEPTTGLDPIMGHVIDDLIVKVVQKMGATVLTITHDMASAKRISNKIAMIYQGKILWSGLTNQIDHSGHPHVEQFINGNIKGPIQMAVRKD
ncbi:MAG: ATP-binding cassette domain-containing protein, partial [Pseudomonadota bacterium]